MWPDIRYAYGWLKEAANILKNEASESAAAVRERYQALLSRMREQAEQAGELKSAVDHFLKVSQSYWDGLFHCYDVAGLPRTNNDLEHLFGSVRHHERRVKGAKKAPASLVYRGAAHLLAIVLTMLAPFTAAQLAGVDLDEWRTLRGKLKQRHQSRILQRRFRRNPDAYLTDLQTRLLKLDLPP